MKSPDIASRRFSGLDPPNGGTPMRRPSTVTHAPRCAAARHRHKLTPYAMNRLIERNGHALWVAAAEHIPGLGQIHCATCRSVSPELTARQIPGYLKEHTSRPPVSELTDTAARYFRMLRE
jgi:hypothetical protein